MDQLARPGASEHDVGLTRRDYGEGDDVTPQQDLVEALLKSSSDGGKTVSLDDLIKHKGKEDGGTARAKPEGVKVWRRTAKDSPGRGGLHGWFVWG